MKRCKIKINKVKLPSYGIIAQSLQQRPDFNIAPHCHNHAVLIYTASGEGSLVAANEKYKLKSDTAIVIDKNIPHQLQEIDGKSMTIFSIYFDPSATGINSEINNSLLQETSRLETPVYYARNIRRTIRQILYEQKTRQAGFDVSIRQCLTSILLQLYRMKLSLKSELHDNTSESLRRVEDVLDYVADNYFETPGLSESAKMAKLSQRQFSSLCKNIKGTSYVQYVNTLRTDRAKDLLEKTEMSVAAIAFEVGFEDLSTFYRAFKKHFKTSPLTFR